MMGSEIFFALGGVRLRGRESPLRAEGEGG